MKIAHTIDSGGFYGAERVLLGLVRGQLSAGHEAYIVSVGERSIEEKAVEREALKAGIPLEKVRMAPGPNFIGGLRLLRDLRDGGVDIIHSHGYKTSVLLGFLPKFLRPCPIVATCHGWITPRKFSKQSVYVWADSKSLKRLDGVVIVSEAMKRHQLFKGSGLKECEVVYNGIETEQLSELSGKGFTPLQRLVDFIEGGTCFCAVGRLAEEKGFDQLLLALSGLVRAGASPKLVIFGEGPLRSELEQLAADLEIRDRVMMPGHVPDMVGYLPMFDAFVMSSHTEGFPMSLLEAMLAGLPVVATNVGGIAHALEGGKCGILVPPADVEALETGLMRLLEDSGLREHFRSEGPERVRRFFSTEAMTENYAHFYENVIDAWKGGHG